MGGRHAASTSTHIHRSIRLITVIKIKLHSNCTWLRNTAIAVGQEAGASTVSGVGDGDGDGTLANVWKCGKSFCKSENVNMRNGEKRMNAKAKLVSHLLATQTQRTMHYSLLFVWETTQSARLRLINTENKCFFSAFFLHCCRRWRLRWRVVFILPATTM